MDIDNRFVAGEDGGKGRSGSTLSVLQGENQRNAARPVYLYQL